MFGRPIRQCGKEVFQFKCRGDKSQTQEIDQGKIKEKEKQRNQNQEEREVRQRSQQGDCKKNWQALFKASGTEDEKKADLKKSQAVEGICDCGAKRLE